MMTLRPPSGSNWSQLESETSSFGKGQAADSCWSMHGSPVFNRHFSATIVGEWTFGTASKIADEGSPDRNAPTADVNQPATATGCFASQGSRNLPSLER